MLQIQRRHLTFQMEHSELLFQEILNPHPHPIFIMRVDIDGMAAVAT